MKRSSYFALGLLLAVSCGVLAVTSGGFPSNPVVRSLVVSCNNAAGCSPASGPDTRAHICNTGAPSGSRCYSLDLDNTGAFSLVLEADNMTGLSNSIQVTRSGATATAMKFNGSELAYNGFRNPKFSFGEFIGNAGGCSNNSGVWQTQNTTGTCTRNSVGNYTINFNTAYAGSPVCNAQITSALAGIAGVNTAGTTSVTVQVGTTAFAAQDGSFFLTCMGF
jgi:hypothetical protein